MTVRVAGCVVLAALLLGLALASGTARAQPVATGTDAVALDAGGCTSLSPEAVRELVALELSPRPVVLVAGGDAGGTPAATEARLDCDRDSATLRVRDRARAEPLHLELDLTRTPAPARTRLVALTLSELVVTSRMEGEPPPAPAPAAPVPPEPPVVPVAARTSLWLGVLAVRQGAPAGLALGPQLGGLAVLSPLALHASLQVEWGSERIDGADVRARTLSLSLAPGLCLPFGDLQAFVGAGVQVGHARLEASSAGSGVEGRALSGLWHAPALTLAVQLGVADPLALHLAADLAYVTRPVRGLDQRQGTASELYAHEGLRLGLALGLALRP